jgi:hypothetical protein
VMMTRNRRKMVPMSKIFVYNISFLPSLINIWD